MSHMKKIFENETKIRINLIGPAKSGKSTLVFNLAKKGVFESQKNIPNTIFPTEVLYSSPRSNCIKVYLDFEEKERVITNIKTSILNLINDVFMEEVKCKDSGIAKSHFYEKFQAESEGGFEVPLARLFGTENIKKIFRNVNFNKVFSDLTKVNKNDFLEERDEYIWNSYFCSFKKELEERYEYWMKMISQIYNYDEEGCRYYSENDEKAVYLNKDFNKLLEMIYADNNSCGLLIKRAYMEVPAVDDKYIRSIFIDYNNKNSNKNIANNIEDIVSEDYKELFIIVGNCLESNNDLLKIKKSVNRITLEKRIFCILNKFDLYRNNMTHTIDNPIEFIKGRTSKLLGIKENRIIVTEKFMDIDRTTLKILPSNKEFIKLFTNLKKQSEHISKIIKVKNSPTDNIINISLNQERMSVQALMNMLYDRYNGYLVDLWDDIIKQEKEDDKKKKYYYSCVRNVIKNRKDDFKGFRCEKKGFLNYNKAIDFSITHGDYNDSKKIVRMLVNYGYNTVGFNSNENKILVTVNGEISKEDKENLIKSIKGRLEESGVKYFENAFLMDVSKKKFNVNSLKTSLEVEKSITVDDFYSAFKTAFKKMSENIERYEISLID